MKKLLLISMCLILWALSTSVKADDEAAERGFSHRMEGSATLVSGEKVDVNMLIGFQQSSRGWYFRAGPDYVFRDTPPRAYYFNLILTGDGHAYVLEFGQELITHFQIEIAGREIELAQSTDKEIPYGMRLRIDDRQFLFDSSHPRIRLELTEQGLQHIVAEHTLRDLSIRRAQ